MSPRIAELTIFQNWVRKERGFGTGPYPGFVGKAEVRARAKRVRLARRRRKFLDFLPHANPLDVIWQ